MALKPDRKYHMGTDIHYFMNVVAERGIIVVHDTSTTGLGAAMDDANAVVKIPTGTGDGVPAGLLLNDVVNLDLTRQHINWHKDEVQIGGKVAVLTHGWVVTNKLDASNQPTQAGDAVYMAATGLIGTASVTGKQVGKALSGPDADGYAKIEINIPM